jgi:uncharacterized surface protein with fasciclin (FAS1) repeats
MNCLIYRTKLSSLALLTSFILMATSCNKDLEQFSETPVEPATGITLGETLASSADDALFYKVLDRANKLPLLNDKTKTFTIFSPYNDAIKSFITAASGGLVPAGSPDAVYEGFISTFLSPGLADTLVSYHILPQKVAAGSIPTTFPNFPYPTLFNPASSLSVFARLDAYTSRRDNGAWVNNIPVIAPDIMAANGVIHRIAAVMVPPSQLLLQRIASDTSLTYLFAAIIRADSGAVASSTSSLQYYLGSPAIALGANFTIFAPTNQAFRNTLYAQAFPVVYGQLYQGAYAQATAAGASAAQAQAAATGYADANAPAATTGTIATPGIFQNPALFPFLPAQAVKAILFNHILGARAFSVNLPGTAASVPTLLNSAIPTNPGISVTATFTGPVVTAGTVKGAGNATAANMLINPFPGGTSDQHYVNGVLHKIDQVLLFQ